jgi:hypothetical protein
MLLELWCVPFFRHALYYKQFKKRMHSVTISNRSLNYAELFQKPQDLRTRVMGIKFISYFSIMIPLNISVPRGSANEVK